jgi:hypothetical protein
VEMGERRGAGMRTECVFGFVHGGILLILLDFDVSVTRELGVIHNLSLSSRQSPTSMWPGALLYWNAYL